jgi:hypothetical protein
MVMRADRSGLDEFEGIVKDVEHEVASDGRRQYHVRIQATNIDVGGATGLMHEWVSLSPKCTEDSVPQGSVMDNYLRQIEVCVRDAKKVATLKEAFALLVGKKFRFARMKLGKDYEGNPAREYIVPVALIQ